MSLIQPSTSPSSSPSKKPTESPTASPSSVVQALACPPAGQSATVTPGIKSVTAAGTDQYCGVFLQKQSGDLVPLARSYNSFDWEAAPGPMACPPEDVSATQINLPDIVDPNDSYIVVSKDGSMDDSVSRARFLEMTTFGPTAQEMVSLTSKGAWGPQVRAQHIRDQMDLPATSHREYWRKRTNSKYDATTQVARSDHPCSPNSKWRRYSYLRQDRYDTITSQYIYTYYEVVPEEANFTYTLYEADENSPFVKNVDLGTYRPYSDGTGANSGYSGTGYYDFGGTNSFMEFELNITEAGEYPLSFRYAMGSSSYDFNRPCQLWINNILIKAVYDFEFTGSWSYWKYSELLNVTFNGGLNTIKLIVKDQNGGPNIDHFRIGKPPAVVTKSECATIFVQLSCNFITL